MSRKKNKTVVNKHKEIEKREPSPFDNIVLREKDERIPATPVNKSVKKKPSEIVQGYNPSMSFADILYSYESTGNPYSMPKPKVSKSNAKEDFGAILDQWEGRGKSKVQKRVESVKNTYKPTKSFGDILSAYEKGGEVKKEPLPNKRKENIHIENFFKEEDEDNKIADGVTWSILGGKQERKIQIKEEESVAKKKEIKRVSSPYKPKKDFSAILEQYENKPIVSNVKTDDSTPVAKESEKIIPVSDKGFFRERDEDANVSKNISWSIIGGRNEDFVRPNIEKPSEPVFKKENKTVDYKPEKEFSDILDTFHKKEEVKTFDEILKEKGDNLYSKPKLSISKLRSMAPQATLDLHGETQQDAEALIKRFIAECVESGLKKVCIITGKGIHSEGGEGVLRSVAERILEKSGMVSEKNNAPFNAGGSGALWIILKG